MTLSQTPAHIRRTPAELAAGRLMRAPDHPTGGESGGGGGGDGGQQPQNNQGNLGGGNSGFGENGGGGNQNNTGTQFDPSAFWSSPSGGEGSSSSGESAGSTNPDGQPRNHGQEFASRLNGLNFAPNVFTNEAVESMNNGDATQLHQNLNNMGREVTRQAVLMSAQLMQLFGEQMMNDVQDRIQQAFTGRDDESNLGKEIPSYNKPGMKPIIDGIFAQAMTVTNGNRQAALAMTKEMLKMQAGNLAQDFNIGTPPPGPGDSGHTTDWVAALLGRDGE